MPLPVAHGLLGAAVTAAISHESRSRRRKVLLTGVLLAICPDFDYAHRIDNLWSDLACSRSRKEIVDSA